MKPIAMKVALVAVLILVPLTEAMAADVWLHSKIARVYTLSGGGFVLQFEDDAPACTNANSPKYFYVSVGNNGVTQEGMQNLLASALTAASTGVNVSVYFDDSTTSCFINRIIVRFDGS